MHGSTGRDEGGAQSKGPSAPLNWNRRLAGGDLHSEIAARLVSR